MPSSFDGEVDTNFRWLLPTTAITLRHRTIRYMTYGWHAKRCRYGGIQLDSTSMVQDIISRQRERCVHSGQISPLYGQLASALYENTQEIYSLVSQNWSKEAGTSLLHQERIRKYRLLIICANSAKKGCECWRDVVGWQRTLRYTGLAYSTSLVSSSAASSKRN